jgi:hypothetical protein
MKSIKRLPSASSTIAPEPPLITSGYSLMYDVEVNRASRSMMSLPFGPGSGVSTRG